MGLHRRRKDVARCRPAAKWHQLSPPTTKARPQQHARLLAQFQLKVVGGLGGLGSRRSLQQGLLLFEMKEGG